LEGPHTTSSGTTPPAKADQGFPKKLRLSGHSASDRLFSLGKELGQSFGHHPLRFVWVTKSLETDTAPAQVAFLISVPKRQVKLATDRNRIKRHLREAIRLNFRQSLLPLLPPGTRLEVAILFTGGKTKFSFQELEKKLISGFKRLGEKAGLSLPTSEKPPRPSGTPP